MSLCIKQLTFLLNIIIFFFKIPKFRKIDLHKIIFISNLLIINILYCRFYVGFV